MNFLTVITSLFVCASVMFSSVAHAEIGLGTRTQTRTFDGVRLAVETYRPNCPDPDIMFVHHGSSRSTYSSGYKVVADRECLIVFAPIFPESSFNSRTYQKGGVVSSSGALLPKSQWTTRLERLMVAWARSEVLGAEEVYLFGFSAGGQYLSRVAAYDPVNGVTRYVVGSPSTHVLPSLTEDVPHGFDRLGASDVEIAAMRAYLALPLTIYVGASDNNPSDSDLDTSAAAMRQGRHRLERAQNTFALGKQVALDNGWSFNWTLVVAPNVGHSGSTLLKAPETGGAFTFGEEPVPPCTCP